MPDNSHGIKVSGKNFQRLQNIQRARETYDDVINRLLAVWEWATRAADLLEGSAAYAKWQNERKEAGPPADAKGPAAELSDVHVE